MLALQIEVDGNPYLTASTEDWALLCLTVAARRGEAASPTQSLRADRIDLSVGGRSQSNEQGISQFLRWGGLDLTVGSSVTVTLIETDSPTPPIRRYRSDDEVQEQPFTKEELRESRWKDYLELKKEFEGNSAA
jgi:hypothetical protein